MTLREEMRKERLWLLVAMVLGSLALSIGLSYFTVRTSFAAVIIQFSLLFLLYAGLMATVKSGWEIKLLLAAAVLLRMALLFSLPNLSDDFYRFLWDGNLWADGFNAYAATPAQALAEWTKGPKSEFYHRLFPLLNSPEYFTIYPPVNQWIFAASAWLFPGQMLEPVVLMKGTMLLAECGPILLLLKLTDQLGIAQKQVLWYALNPLIIIELTGNLHFEALMIFFTLLMVWLVMKGKHHLAALALAFAVAVKLLPLLFLPLLLGHVTISGSRNWRKADWRRVASTLAVFLLTLLLMAWSLSDFSRYAAIWQSVRLYYESFEFNAGLYLLVKDLAYRTGGARTMANVVLGLLLLTGLALVYLRHFKLLRQSQEQALRYLPAALLWIMALYYFTSSTIHPWYVSSLIAFCCLTRFRFPILWSVLVPLTYITYITMPYRQNYSIMLIEYLVLAAWLIYELRRGNQFWTYGRT